MANIIVLYHSDTGNTRKLAEWIADGVRTAGGDSVKLMSAGQMDMEQAATADVLAIGSPDYFSYVAGAIKTFFDRAYGDGRFKSKSFAAFGTHGGGGKVVGAIESLAKAVGMTRLADGLLVKGAPQAADQAKAQELGQKIAQAAKK